MNKYKGYRIGGGDSHKSGITGIGEALDPTSYFAKAVGVKELNPHTYIKPGTDWLNEKLSVVTKPVNQFMTKITPGKQYLDDNIPILKQWNQTVENRPVDAAGIAAATFFTGGAAMGAGGGAGAAGGAASTGVGGSAAGMGAAGTAAITPTFASGVGAVAPTASGAAMSSAITPAFASGVGATSASATPLLGYAGSATASSMLPTASSALSMGGEGLGSSFFTAENAKKAYDLANLTKSSMDQGQQQPQQFQQQQVTGMGPRSSGLDTTNPINTNSAGFNEGELQKQIQMWIDKLKQNSQWSGN